MKKESKRAEGTSVKGEHAPKTGISLSKNTPDNENEDSSETEFENNAALYRTNLQQSENLKSKLWDRLEGYSLMN